MAHQEAMAGLQSFTLTNRWNFSTESVP